MGRAPRPFPARLAAKLQQIRTALDLSQAEMFERLGDTGTRLYVRHIDNYEKGKRIPHLEVVLAYARAAGIPMDVIVNDELNLPGRLPTPSNYDWVLRNGKWVMKRVRTKRAKRGEQKS
jgi:transcriptional regulator with XRE-family HTH domain